MKVIIYYHSKTSTFLIYLEGQKEVKNVGLTNHQSGLKFGHSDILTPMPAFKLVNIDYKPAYDSNNSYI